MLVALLAASTLGSLRPSSAGATTSAPTISVGTATNLSQASGNQFEGAVAIDPSNPSHMFVLGRDESGNMIGARSSDGGATWTHSRVGTGIASTSKLPPGWGNASVAFDQYGNLFVVYLSTGTSTYTDFALSVDGGATFSHQVALASLTDQPVVAVGAGSVWVTFNHGGVNYAVGTTVTGLGAMGTFGVAQAIPGANGGSFGDLTVGPQGQVMAAFGPNGATGGVVVSIDPDGLGPLGFTTAVEAAPTNVPGFDYIPAAPNWGIDSEAHLAWDLSGGPHNGRVYLSYLDAPSTDLSNTMLYVTHSDDGGTTWSSPVLINDDGTSASHFMPGFAVDQTTGTVGATWYDTRGDTTRVNATYYGSVSIDGGDSWSTNFPIAAGTSNATYAPPPGSIRNTNWGDYTGLAFNAGVMVPVWADNSNSTGNNAAGANGSFDLYAALVTVTIPDSAPTVATQPTATSVASGSTYSFSAAAAGRPTPTVQWQRSNDAGATWTSIGGATATTYSATAATIDNGAQFEAVFTNGYGSATTNAATLSVTAVPVITTQPTDSSVASGFTFSMSAAASGLPAPTVQWQRSNDGGTTWTSIGGATATTYSALAAITDAGAQFQAVFTNGSGSATTSAATLSVTTTTTIVLATNHTSLKAGKNATLTVTLTSPVTGKKKITTGTVTIFDGTTAVTTISVVKGKTKFITSFAPGTHVLHAVYSGAGSVLAAISTTITILAA